jgi:PIN domain nuclease of toxin-antitoxin system
MRLLLDTHALLWWTLTPERLSEKTRNLLADSTATRQVVDHKK